MTKSFPRFFQGNYDFFYITPTVYDLSIKMDAPKDSKADRKALWSRPQARNILFENSFALQRITLCN